MESSEQIHQLALALATGVGTKMARNLIKQTGSVSSIFEEKTGNLLKIPGFGQKIADSLKEDGLIKRAEKEIQFIRENKVHMVFFLDADYPSSLRQCPDAPIVLFYKGTLPSHLPHSLSIIGTRNPTQRGRELTNQWVGELAATLPDLYIISGLAYGIDIAAHEAALANNLPTLAVLGHGFHTLYPSVHRQAAERIIKQGALVSDFFSHNKMEPKNFIRRNRIIAGLSQATLVIESSLKGGAMATAEMANSYNREVLAVPGRPQDERSLGCNHLIRSNQAALVNQPSDICFFMGWDGKPQKDAQKLLSTPDERGLTEMQSGILNILRKEPLNINELGILVQQHPAKLTGDLLTLEFGGFIQAAPGGRFRALGC